MKRKRMVMVPLTKTKKQNTNAADDAVPAGGAVDDVHVRGQSLRRLLRRRRERLPNVPRLHPRPERYVFLGFTLF